MVASSKLHRAQQAIENMRPYERHLSRIMATLVSSLGDEVSTPYGVVRDVRRVAIVVYTSNSSLCGGFNANAIKAFTAKVKAYRDAGVEVVKVFALGRKAYDAACKAGFKDLDDYSALLDHPAYSAAASIAAEIMRLYSTEAIDRADLIYHHFKSAGAQVLTEEQFLPVELKSDAVESDEKVDRWTLDFIVEPSKEQVVRQLVPKSLYIKIFTALLDSLASEHAARVVAMQVATDNADDLLRELTLTYNKTRQYAITAELLDIVGGSMK